MNSNNLIDQKAGQQDSSFSEQDISPVPDRFAHLTGIEPLQLTPEIDKLRNGLSKEAAKVAETFKAGGHISDAEAASIQQLWENSILLGQRGMEKFGRWRSNIFRTAVKDISGQDPEGNDPNAQHLIEEATRLISAIEDEARRAVAFTYRTEVVPGITPPGEYPPRFVLLNVDKLTPETPKTHARAVAFEETVHALSKLDQYPDVNKKWVEEMVAKALSLTVASNDSETSAVDLKEMAAATRSEPYLLLFRAIQKKTGETNTLVNMYFGREPYNSPNVKKAQAAIQDLDMIGQLIDSGYSIKFD